MLRFVMLFYVKIHHVTLCYVVFHCYIPLRYITLCCVSLCYFMLQYIMLHCVTLCFTFTFRYATLLYVTFRYATLHYVNTVLLMLMRNYLLLLVL